MHIKNFFSKLLEWNEQQDYNFSLPENNSNTQEEDYLTQSKLESSSNIFPSLDVNLEYLQSRFNTMINSDIVIREFTLSARNRQYKALLLFIDGMVDSTSINNFILRPLMLKNQANSFEGEQTHIISEAVTNNITVRRVKKFNIVDYIDSCLIPQNNVKKQKDYNDLIDNVNARKLCFICRYLRFCF